jgi:hypothetical protein
LLTALGLNQSSVAGSNCQNLVMDLT